MLLIWLEKHDTLSNRCHKGCDLVPLLLSEEETAQFDKGFILTFTFGSLNPALFIYTVKNDEF